MFIIILNKNQKNLSMIILLIMNTTLIIVIILGLLAIYLYYNMKKDYNKIKKEKFVQDEIKSLEDQKIKEQEEQKRKEKEITDNIELLEKKQGQLEDILEKDKKTLSSKFTGDKLKEEMKKLSDNYNVNYNKIKDEIDKLLQDLNKVRGINQ
jgi:hypothetical protein